MFYSEPSVWESFELVCPKPPPWGQTGLTAAQQAEWLVDCYRMRLDDDYVYSGDGGGIYNPEACAEGVVEDFLVRGMGWGTGHGQWWIEMWQIVVLFCAALC